MGEKETPKKGFPVRSGFQRKSEARKKKEKMSDVGNITEIRKINAEGQLVAGAGMPPPSGEGI